MFDKQARFRVGEFDGEKECATVKKNVPPAMKFLR